MIKLSDTQLAVLSAACQRPNRNVVPLPANLKGGAQQKVVASLLAKGLAEECVAGLDDLAWRTDEDGRKLVLLATDAAFHALGIEPEGSSGDAESTRTAQSPKRGRGRKGPGASMESSAGSTAPEQATSRQPRTETKQALLITMLQQPDGASLDEIVAATGWQAHTVRGAIAGALKKKLGLEVSSEKVEGRGRVYHIKQS